MEVLQRRGKRRRHTARKGYRPTERFAPPLPRFDSECNHRSPCRHEQRDVLRAKGYRGVMLGKHVDQRGNGGEDLGHGRQELEEEDAPDDERQVG